MFSTNCVPFYSSEDIKCKGLEREWTQMYQVREVETALSVLRNHSLALSFVLAEKDESSSSHKPLGPRTGSRYTACCGYSFFFLFWVFSLSLGLTSCETLNRSLLSPSPVGKACFRINNVSLTLELVRHANPQAPPRPTESDTKLQVA